jgi:membrane protein
MLSSGLAFETLLSIVPLTAVAMALVRAIGGPALQFDVLHFLAEQYVPSAANGAIERILPLLEHLDLETIGWLGLIALVPVMFSLIDAVELALSDIFAAPRRTHWFRLAFLGAVLTLGPIGSILTVRYVPLDAFGVGEVLTPLLAMSVLLYVVFKGLPSVQLSERAALTGALTAGVLLALAKAGFGLYATHLATSIHVLWGAIAFVPLLLFWVLLSWATSLLGAEIAATLQVELTMIEHPTDHRPTRSRRRFSRLRRRLAALRTRSRSD